MKKLITIIFSLFIFTNCVCAEDFDFGGSGDLWDKFNSQLNPLSKDQKAVSDEQFNSIVEKLKQKRQKKPKKMKGDSIQQSNETEEIVKTLETLPIVSVAIPLKLSDDAILPEGHYQVKGEMTDGKPHIKLYQAHFLMADFPATETKDDFGEPELDFARLIDYNNDQLKLIFGSIDFNAYTIIDIAK